MIYLPVKRGDQPTARGKEYAGVKWGMPCGYISEAEWGKPFDKIVKPGTRQLHAYGWIRFDESDKPMLREWQKPQGYLKTLDSLGNKIRDKKTYTRTSKRLDRSLLHKDVLQKLDDPNDLNCIFTKDDVSSAFDDASKLRAAETQIDEYQITEGTYEIGDDFATWALGVGDRGNCTGNLTLRQITEVTETAGSPSTEDLNGHSVFYESDTQTKGNFLLGHKINQNFDGDLFTINDEGPGSFCFQYLYHFCQFALTSNYQAFFTDNPTTSFTTILRNCIGDGNGNIGRRFYRNQATVTIRIYNCMAYQYQKDTYALAVNGDVILENCVAIGGTADGFDALGNNNKFYNCVAFGNGNDFNGIGSATGRNNASSDGTCADGNWGTGSDNQPNLTPADEFRSLAPADGHLFALPFKDSVLHDGGIGTSIAGNTRHITGFLRHVPNPIGAKQIFPPYHPSSVSNSFSNTN